MKRDQTIIYLIGGLILYFLFFHKTGKTQTIDPTSVSTDPDPTVYSGGDPMPMPTTTQARRGMSVNPNRTGVLNYDTGFNVNPNRSADGSMMIASNI